MTARWLAGNMMAFDLETTSADPETARIVTCAAIQCGPGGAVPCGDWLVNPGCEIPAEAIAVHGVTNEMAASGMPYDEAIAAIANTLAAAWCAGTPVVAMNANFDMTIIDREASRVYGDWPGPGNILDPRVIDLACDKYRPGKRKLLDLAAHYRVKLGEAHTASGDALMAARIVWAQARRYPLIADKTLAEMQTLQADAYREWAEHLTEYYASQGKNEVIDRGWPLRGAPVVPDVRDPADFRLEASTPEIF